jgi:hypothetical protein
VEPVRQPTKRERKEIVGFAELCQKHGISCTGPFAFYQEYVRTFCTSKQAEWRLQIPREMFEDIWRRIREDAR